MADGGDGKPSYAYQAFVGDPLMLAPLPDPMAFASRVEAIVGGPP